MVTTLAAPQWTAACRSTRLQPDRGVAVLLPDGRQAALFRTRGGALYAIDNIDPFSGAAVLCRGIVGDRQGRPTVASPLYKQVFRLDSGACLDNPDVVVDTFAVREQRGVVEVSAEVDGP